MCSDWIKSTRKIKKYEIYVRSFVDLTNAAAAVEKVIFPPTIDESVTTRKDSNQSENDKYVQDDYSRYDNDAPYDANEANVGHASVYW